MYKHLIDRARRERPNLRNAAALKNKVMSEIGTEAKERRFINFIKVAVSVVLLFSLGSYIWMEVYTWESRLAIEKQKAPLLYKSDWHCRMTAHELLQSLFETRALARHNDGVIINKGNMKLLKVENAELFKVMENVLGYIEHYSPSDFQAFQSGKDIRLSTWQLRHTYSFCEWITN